MYTQTLGDADWSSLLSSVVNAYGQTQAIKAQAAQAQARAAAIPLLPPPPVTPAPYRQVMPQATLLLFAALAAASVLLLSGTRRR